MSTLFEVPTVAKRSYEAFFVFVNFRRTDGNGWLAADEAITGTPSVTVKEKSTQTDVSSDMADNVSAQDGTIAKHRIKGGTAGKTYVVSVKIETDKTQKFEFKYELKVNDKP